MRVGGFGFESSSKDSTPSSSPRDLSKPQRGSENSSSDFTYTALAPVASNEIEFFIEAPTKKKPREACRSEPKTVGCFTFDILAFPSGNQMAASANPKMAVYVECAGVDSKDDRWVYNSVKFSLCIVNVKDYRKSIYHEDTHSFCASAVDRGWPDLLAHSDMTQESGWLDERDRLCIRASVCVRQADTIFMPSDYDTRKETGFIGLRNHGATCYLNGLLQSYYHIGKFREIVYRMQDDESPSHKPSSSRDGAESPSGGTRMSLPLALQSVFLRLESSEQPVNTMELTRAFGWDSMDAFTQHDVQELARILCDKLEEKLKGSPTDDKAIQSLFEGQVENFIECLDVEYKSTKLESFYDVPVNVRGLAGDPLGNLSEALREFTAVEVMEGENAYDAESLGKQRARKGIRFAKFPPVLCFQLKRFSFDYEKLDNVKLHDKFIFPTTLCLDEFLPDAGEYALHTVLVHSGDVHSGHYYAFTRPYLGCAESKRRDEWYKFDDEQVSRCSELAAVDDNFGGVDLFPHPPYPATPKRVTRPRIHSAYMLVYIKRSEVGRILAQPKSSHLQSVQDRVAAESKRIEERKRLNEADKQSVSVCLHTTARVSTDTCEDPSKAVVFGLPLNCANSDLVVKVRKDTRMDDVVSALLPMISSVDAINAKDASSDNVALFYWRPNECRWRLVTLLSPDARPMKGHTRSISADILSALTPRSAFHETPIAQYLTAAGPGDIAGDNCRTIGEVIGDASTSCVHVLAVVGKEQFVHWTDSTPIALVIVKYFDPVAATLKIIGTRVVCTEDRVASLLPWLLSQLGGVKPDPVQMDDWLVFEESTCSTAGEVRMRAVEMGGTFVAESVGSGSILVFQPNTLLEVETDESSCEDNEDEEENEALEKVEWVDLQTVTEPTYVVRTVNDFAQSRHANVSVRVHLRSPEMPARCDGISPGSTDSHIDSPVSAPSAEIMVDRRWTLPVVMKKVQAQLKLVGQNMQVFEQDPLEVRSAPIALVKADGKCTGKRVKVSQCKHVTGVWNLFIVQAEDSAVCVRVFDDSVTEVASCWLNVDVGVKTVSDLVNGVAATRTAGKAVHGWRIVESRKGQIRHVLKGNDSIDLPGRIAATVNPLYDFIRIEPDTDDTDKSDGSGQNVTCHVSYVDKSSGIHFGYPFILRVAVSEGTAKQVKAKIHEKLKGAGGSSRWRLCTVSSSGKLVHLKDDESVVPTGDVRESSSILQLALEVQHPNPELLGVHRNTAAAAASGMYKPLTIR